MPAGGEWKLQYVGVDVHKKRCIACIMDEHGSIVEEITFDNNNDGICEFVSRLNHAKVVMESTANLWIPLYEALESNGITAVLANPNKTKAIAQAKIKSDRLDARTLAHLLRTDMVASSHVPDKYVRDLRALVRHRASLARNRTEVKNKVHAILDRHNIKHDYSDVFGKGGMEFLNNLQLSSIDRLMLDNHLKHIESLNEQISLVTNEIAKHAVNDDRIELLMSMPGIDYYTAMVIVTEIDDISRFQDARKLVAWCGLAPSLHQSGNTSRTGHITKQGSRMLRWIMVESANTARRHDDRFKIFYERIARKHGHSKAIVALANKMLRIVWHMLAKNEPYRDHNKQAYAKKVKRLHKLTE
jgi:transposase